MKKLFSFVLSLCMVTALVVGFSVTAGAASDDISVTVGQSFAWNDSSADSTAWLQSKGVSPDGLWKYQFYALEKEIYQDLSSVYSGGFAWSTAPGNYGIGYARVRNNGINFHPGQTADVVKVFTCPSGGTIEVSSVVTRQVAVPDSGTGTSFAVYLDDTLVYPTDGREYLALTTADPQSVTFSVDVAKNQRLRFHIGSIEGNALNDSTDMLNVVTYKAVNDSTAGGVEENNTIIFYTKPDMDIIVPGSYDYDSAYGGTQDVSDSVDEDEDSVTTEAGDPSDRDDESDDKNDDRDDEDEDDSDSSDLVLLITLIAVGGLILISIVVLIIVTKKKN